MHDIYRGIYLHVQGVLFRTVFFENVPESELLDNLTTAYDFFMAKSWNF